MKTKTIEDKMINIYNEIQRLQDEYENQHPPIQMIYHLINAKREIEKAYNTVKITNY